MKEATIEFLSPGGSELILKLTGNWHMVDKTPAVADVVGEMRQGSIVKVSFDSAELLSWDTCLLTFIIDLEEQLHAVGVELNLSGLPEGVQQLYTLSKEVPKKEGAERGQTTRSFFERIGEDAIHFLKSIQKILSFIGEVTFPVWRFFSGRIQFRWSDFGIFLQETGVYAVPIVSLISFLFGVILAFVGVMQLKLFGAQVYVADLVGIATVRIMGAVMTGIIMAGRTGAAFAAQLGTMVVNEEIDALKTLGISPVEFLVLPRMIALTLMMPLLTLFANLMGIIGGGAVAVGVYDINSVVYFSRVSEAVTLNDLFIGLFSGTTFGVLISLAGCLRGLECGSDASAVGDATTSAVVTSIVAIIVDTAIIIIACSILGI
ncbi:MlaE family ABC transporter permease [Desulfosediminicola sp.]|uniref:MlaE family ABC transporter permease n=1 Tax=Desulfosediminicola sp. TaxID=2886825 RepID=UPI003AF217D7